MIGHGWAGTDFAKGFVVIFQLYRLIQATTLIGWRQLGTDRSCRSKEHNVVVVIIVMVTIFAAGLMA